ncbi:unnamed protein product [Peronospora destructor]|uniref:Uncharacterized protein n=1 Tax=Peronospora destructor TaxID=86335 RepID=A0AAV0U227_9STRA|nr:unnamed protein product [Peronospora destructor]
MPSNITSQFAAQTKELVERAKNNMLLKYVVLASALGSILSNDGLATADKPDMLRRGFTEEQEVVSFASTAEGLPTTRKLVPAAASYTDGLDDTDSQSTGGKPDLETLTKASAGSSGGKTPGGLTAKDMSDIDEIMKIIMNSGSADLLEDDQAKEKEKSDKDANTNPKSSKQDTSDISDLLDKLMATGGSTGGKLDLETLTKASAGSSGGKTPGGLTAKGMSDIDEKIKSIMDSGSADLLEDDQAKEKDKSDKDANTNPKSSKQDTSDISDLLDKLMATGGSTGGKLDLETLTKASAGSSGGKTPGGLTAKGMSDIDEKIKSIMDSGSADLLEDDQAKEKDKSDKDANTNPKSSKQDTSDISDLLDKLMATGGSTGGKLDLETLTKASAGSSGGKTPGGLTAKGMSDIDEKIKSIMDSGSADLLEDDQAKDGWLDAFTDSSAESSKSTDSFFKKTQKDVNDADTQSLSHTDLGTSGAPDKKGETDGGVGTVTVNKPGVAKPTCNILHRLTNWIGTKLNMSNNCP